jgi:hypothetical protein
MARFTKVLKFTKPMKSLRFMAPVKPCNVELWVGGMKIADNQGDGTLNFFSGPFVVPFNLLKYTPVGLVSDSEIPEVEIETTNDVFPSDYETGVERRDGTRNRMIFTQGLFTLGSPEWQ